MSGGGAEGCGALELKRRFLKYFDTPEYIFWLHAKILKSLQQDFEILARSQQDRN